MKEQDTFHVCACYLVLLQPLTRIQTCAALKVKHLKTQNGNVLGPKTAFHPAFQCSHLEQICLCLEMLLICVQPCKAFCNSVFKRINKVSSLLLF